jgi:hypothetical protein
MSDRIRLGDRVLCTAYVKRSGNCYQITGDDCFFHEGGTTKSEEVDGDHWCDRYRTITKQFFGIYVGATTLCTRLVADYEYSQYGNSGYRAHSDMPEKFAVVYYADNKKRLVPIDRVTPEAQNGA